MTLEQIFPTLNLPCCSTIVAEHSESWCYKLMNAYVKIEYSLDVENYRQINLRISVYDVTDLIRHADDPVSCAIFPINRAQNVN